jgi:hypothetical protein
LRTSPTTQLQQARHKAGAKKSGDFFSYSIGGSNISPPTYEIPPTAARISSIYNTTENRTSRENSCNRLHFQVSNGISYIESRIHRHKKSEILDRRR